MKTIAINTSEEVLLKWQGFAARLGISVEESIVRSVAERIERFSEKLPTTVVDGKNTKSQQEVLIKQRDVVYADFSEMAIDREYQKEALEICREFEKADWEALQLGESEYETR
ncbi:MULTISPECIES: hypothetical protein [Aerosakkonema]|uniref:hypothetical protein n=1 Tax=Aerosakkonema TaxID=1246629 RepID=UPI0035B6AC7F